MTFDPVINGKDFLQQTAISMGFFHRELQAGTTEGIPSQGMAAFHGFPALDRFGSELKKLQVVGSVLKNLIMYSMLGQDARHSFCPVPDLRQENEIKLEDGHLMTLCKSEKKSKSPS